MLNHGLMATALSIPPTVASQHEFFPYRMVHAYLQNISTLLFDLDREFICFN